MKNKWYSKDTTFASYGFILGILFSAFDPQFGFSIRNVNPIDVLLSIFLGFIAFQVRHNHSYRSYMDSWIRNLRRISEDPYREYESGIIIDFLKMILNSNAVYTVDRNNPDTWFLNDNYIAFLCLEEQLIRDNNLQGNRVFVWKEECYGQSRYKQLLLLNVYAGVNTYIVPLEFLQKRKNDYLTFLDTKDQNLKAQMDKYSPYKNEWINKLFIESDGEEFLLCEQNGDLNDGLGKVIGKVKSDVIRGRHLTIYERKCYKTFFEWIQSLQRYGNEVALLEPVPPDLDFTTHWSDQIESRIQTIRGL